jgi:chaperonin GroES
MVPIDVRVGDRVVYSKYAGTEVSVAGVAHLVLKSEDVIGTLDGDDIGALKPYGDRVLIVKAALTPSTSGGVLLPSSASDSVPTGRVRAVGPGKLRDDGGRDAMLLDAGAAVLYAQFSGMEFEADAQAPAGYVVVRSDDIMVRLE